MQSYIMKRVSISHLMLVLSHLDDDMEMKKKNLAAGGADTNPVEL